MIRPVAVAVLLTVCLALASAVHAQLDAPVWYVQYEVRIHADASHAQSGMQGPTTVAWKVDNSFENTVKLDMRNMGQVLSLDMSKFDTAKMQNMSPTEQLKMSQQMLDAMQNCANWMVGPVEGLDDGEAMQAHMIATSVPVRINYDCTTTGSNLVTEMGSHYDLLVRTTAVDSSKKVYCSPDQVKFEMNAATHKYWLVIPFVFRSMENKTPEVEFVTVSKTCAPGTNAWGEGERTTNMTSIDIIGSEFKLDTLPNRSQNPLIEGTIDASGRIAGQKSFQGHMTSTGPDVPVTLTYTYTVTQTPPAARPAARPAAKK